MDFGRTLRIGGRMTSASTDLGPGTVLVPCSLRPRALSNQIP